MSELSRTPLCEGVSFNHIADTRFKWGRISASLVVPLQKSTAAANALLSCVLTRSCRQYPDFTALSRKLESLYGAALYPSVRKFGDYQVVSIAASGLDDRYALEGEAVSAELAELLCNILFDPNLADGRFCTEDLEQERRQLIETIDADFNDKHIYAMNRCVQNMCRDEPYAIGRNGSREDVEALTQENVLTAWSHLLKDSRVELFLSGSADPEHAKENFLRHFGSSPRKFPAPSMVIKNEVAEVRRFTETEEIAQSKLVMGFRCAYPQTKEERVANSLLSSVLGGTPTSKLFLNVREKQSLCYYCSSQINNAKGLLFINSGVDTKNIDRAEEAVMDQIRLLKNGCVTEEELQGAKLALKTALISSLDSLGSIQRYYLDGILYGQAVSPREAAALVDNITKDQLVELAQQIKLDTVFSLVGN